MSSQYQKLDMVAQLGKDLSVEEQQRLAALAAQQPQPALTITLDITLAITLAPTTTMAPPLAGAHRASSTHPYATAADDLDDMISEDSLTVSPETKARGRARAGARSSSGSRGTRKTH